MWLNGVQPKLVSILITCVIFCYCYIIVFGLFLVTIFNWMFWLHLIGDLLSCQHIHLLCFHVMDQTCGLLYKDQSCFHQWWGGHLKDHRKQETRVMMSLRTTSSCQDNQNQLFVKNMGKLVTTKGHVKARQLLIRTFHKGGIR